MRLAGGLVLVEHEVGEEAIEEVVWLGFELFVDGCHFVMEEIC